MPLDWYRSPGQLKKGYSQESATVNNSSYLMHLRIDPGARRSKPALQLIK